jgi:Ca-activated chloride channel family protein
MSFHQPEFLFLFVVPVAILAHVVYRKGNRVALPFDHGMQSSGRGLAILITAAEMLPALLLAVVIVLLAVPTQFGEPKDKRVMTNIEFCVDVSGSMTAQFGEGSRYDGSMAAIDKFLDYREGDAFGLTFFGNTVFQWVPLTNDVTAIRHSPPFMDPKLARRPPGLGGTSIGKALLACREHLLEREEGDRMIILVSDGQSSDLGSGQDVEIARRLKNDNIVVYGIHISTGEVPGQIVNITSITGGEAFMPGDPTMLEAVFERIDGMQQTKLEKVAAETMDNFVPPAIVGLSILGLAFLCLFGLRYTPW